MFSFNEWTTQLMRSLSPIAQGLPQAAGDYNNASLYYSVQVSSSEIVYNVTYKGQNVTYKGQNVVYFVRNNGKDAEQLGVSKDHNGNYTVVGGVSTETRVLEAQLKEKTPRYEPSEGIDRKVIFMEGRLVNPLRLPPEINASSSRVTASINGINGTFTFRPALESPSGLIGNISDAIGEPIKGYFQVDSD